MSSLSSPEMLGKTFGDVGEDNQEMLGKTGTLGKTLQELSGTTSRRMGMTSWGGRGMTCLQYHPWDDGEVMSSGRSGKMSEDIVGSSLSLPRDVMGKPCLPYLP